MTSRVVKQVQVEQATVQAPQEMQRPSNSFHMGWLLRARHTALSSRSGTVTFSSFSSTKAGV